MTPYVFATCRVGVENALKAEAQKRRLRPAFMRPGFVSFKIEREVAPDFSFPNVFAHTFAASFGQSTLATLARDAEAAAARVGASRLHVYPRALVGDDERPSELSALIDAVDPGLALPRGKAEIGERVLDVVLVDPGVLMLGAHVHTPEHSPFEGGIPPLVLPKEAPSRAWLKLEEALLWHPRKPAAGERAIEVGSAPGGTVYALLQRGLRVLAVDPAQMDERLRGDFTHLQKPAVHIAKADLDPATRWLLIDINEKPDTTLKLAEKLVPMLPERPSLILTLKLADWELAKEIEHYRARITALGYDAPLLRQLGHGRREVVLLA